MFSLHLCLCEGVGCSGRVDRDSCELPCRCWELKLGLLEDQPALLPTELFLQLLIPQSFSNSSQIFHSLLTRSGALKRLDFLWRHGERTVVRCLPAGASVSARTRSRSSRLFLLLAPGKRRASSGPARSGPRGVAETAASRRQRSPRLAAVWGSGPRRESRPRP